MGLFDIFKRKKTEVRSEDSKQVPSIETQQKKRVTHRIRPDGRLEFEFVDDHPKYDYDVTRLVVADKHLECAGVSLSKFAVSWYSQEDATLPGEEETPRANEYVGVLARIDTELMKEDDEYGVRVMTWLLKQERVNGILGDGLREYPKYSKLSSGEYIGEVIRDEETGKWTKNRSPIIASKAHNMPYMVERRRKYQEKCRRDNEEQKRQREAYEKRQKQMGELFSGIDR